MEMKRFTLMVLVMFVMIAGQAFGQNNWKEDGCFDKSIPYYDEYLEYMQVTLFTSIPSLISTFEGIVYEVPKSGRYAETLKVYSFYHTCYNRTMEYLLRVEKDGYDDKMSLLTVRNMTRSNYVAFIGWYAGFQAKIYEETHDNR
jgi:hypothetical protein